MNKMRNDGITLRTFVGRPTVIPNTRNEIHSPNIFIMIVFLISSSKMPLRSGCVFERNGIHKKKRDRVSNFPSDQVRVELQSYAEAKHLI